MLGRLNHDLIDSASNKTSLIVCTMAHSNSDGEYLGKQWAGVAETHIRISR